MNARPASGSTGDNQGCADEPELRLLGRFDLTGTRASLLGQAGQRLLALIAVRRGAVARWQAAQVLYPDASEAQAASNLRAVLWRMQRGCPSILDATTTEIRMPPRLRVDYWSVVPLAQRLLRGTLALGASELAEALQANLRDDLLPGWPEPWLVPERERFHQLRLHAMEALCSRLTTCGWFGAAVDVGLAAVSADPLRESARCVLIDAYVAEGNACEALRQFGAFRALLEAELGLEPTDALRRRLPSAWACGRPLVRILPTIKL
jgi:DNA-binding SARP family transcriptional activator